jgi:hypothetical protein
MPSLPFDPPSLDCLNLDAMDSSDLDNLALHLETLRAYAIQKSQAMACRQAGRINDALRLESKCDRTYTKIPTIWRW